MTELRNVHELIGIVETYPDQILMPEFSDDAILDKVVERFSQRLEAKGFSCDPKTIKACLKLEIGTKWARSVDSWPPHES
jgi:hypothetical protein